MSHEVIGVAQIGEYTTSIRKYDNGTFVVLVNDEVKYSNTDLNALAKELDEAKINYSLK